MKEAMLILGGAFIGAALTLLSIGQRLEIGVSHVQHAKRVVAFINALPDTDRARFDDAVTNSASRAVAWAATKALAGVKIPEDVRYNK